MSRTDTPTTDCTHHERFSINIGFQIQCFSLNREANRVMVAGRSIIKLLSVDDTRFHENKLEHRFNAFQFSLMDVCWSHADDSLLVSCASDGGLQKWKKSEHSFTLDSSLSIHTRTVNKINLHPCEQHYLLSGDQDGFIHLSDFRAKTNPALTFRHDQNDVVTDLKFHPLNAFQFASASDTGCFFIWDIRSSLKLDKKQNVHSSGVYIDWHPEEKQTLASASRVNRKIYVWDLSTKEKKYSILHSEGVSSIRWRPKHHTQIAACSSNPLDTRLCVWDYKRPYVPYALFDSNKYTNFLWRNSPDVIIASTSTYLYNDYISNARRPAERSCDSLVNIDKNGTIAFATLVKSASIDTQEDETQSIYSEYSNQQHDRAYDDKFKQNKNELYVSADVAELRQDWITYAFRNYRFKDDSFSNLCDYNSQVALKCQKLSIHKDWTILKAIYLNTEQSEVKTEQQQQQNQRKNENYGTSVNLNVTKHSNDDQISMGASCDDQYHEDLYNIEHLNDENVVFKVVEDEDENFLLPNDIIEFNEPHDLFDDYFGTDKSINNVTFGTNMAIVTDVSLDLNENDDESSLTQNAVQTSSTATKEYRLNILSKYLQPEIQKLNFDKYFQEILHMYVEEQSDLPTAITMFLVACKSDRFMINSIDECILDEWFSQYTELLAKYNQWTLRSEILKEHRSEFLEKLTQNSINFMTKCAQCKEELPRTTLQCSKCKKNQFLCSLCHLPVKTLYAWCHVCCHGGHMKHLLSWFSKQRECATGCGCPCWSNSNSKVD